jgi:hypothetical protein
MLQQLLGMYSYTSRRYILAAYLWEVPPREKDMGITILRTTI